MVSRNIKQRSDAVPRQGFSIVFLHPVTNALIEEIPARHSRFRQRRHHFTAPVQQAQHQWLNNSLVLRGSAQVRQGHQHLGTLTSFRVRKLHVSLRRHGSPVPGIMKHQPQPRRREKNAQQHDRSFKHRDAGGLGGKKQHFPLVEGLLPGNQSVAIFPAKNDVKPWPVAAHASDSVRRATMSKPDSPQLLWVEHQAAQQIGKKLLIGGQQGCAHITPCAHPGVPGRSDGHH